MGKTKTVKYNDKAISTLPDNKPVVYKVLNRSGTNTYTGSAKRGRVRDRLTEHLNEIKGSKVQIEQLSSIDEAEKKEAIIIKRTKPIYNKKGK